MFYRLQVALERLRLTINLSKTKIVLFRESLNSIEAQNREWVNSLCVRGLARFDEHGDVVFGKRFKLSAPLNTWALSLMNSSNSIKTWRECWNLHSSCV